MKINGTYFTRLFDKNFEEFETTEEEIAKAFAKGLKDIRKYKNLTLKQVAEGTDIPFPTIARYESGENIPSVIQAFKLSYFYRIEINDIFKAGYIDDESEEQLFDELFDKN